MTTFSDKSAPIAPSLTMRSDLLPLVIGVGLLIITAGCAVGPDYVAPTMQLPPQWNSAAPRLPSSDEKRLAQWWQGLNDPVLTRLIQRAVADNLDVKAALSRVRETRFQRLKTRASLFPTLDASASAKQSGNDSMATGEWYAAGFDAGWEVDLFGGTRRSMEAAQADLAAEIENLNDVRVTLLAEVALNYIDLRTFQDRLAVAQSNVAAMQATWNLLDTLFRAGSGDALAVAQARYNLESAQAKLPDLEVGLEAAMNRLAVLTGQAAGALHAELSVVRPIPKAGADLAVGVPADVLRQRPDIRQAERELAAQTARIGEATAELYPTFALSGSIGLEALSLGDLFSSASRIWSLGPAVSWRIFDAGAVRSAIQVQTELRQQAWVDYQRTVLAALEEVENALVNVDREQQKLTRLQAAADAARSAADLAGKQYITGLTGFSDVLDAQRSLLSFEDQLAESQGALLSDLVQLYKALGGGWQSFGQTSGPNPLRIDES